MKVTISLLFVFLVLNYYAFVECVSSKSNAKKSKSKLKSKAKPQSESEPELQDTDEMKAAHGFRVIRGEEDAHEVHLQIDDDTEVLVATISHKKYNPAFLEKLRKRKDTVIIPCLEVIYEAAHELFLPSGVILNLHPNADRKTLTLTVDAVKERFSKVMVYKELVYTAFPYFGSPYFKHRNWELAFSGKDNHYLKVADCMLNGTVFYAKFHDVVIQSTVNLDILGGTSLVSFITSNNRYIKIKFDYVNATVTHTGNGNVQVVHHHDMSILAVDVTKASLKELDLYEPVDNHCYFISFYARTWLVIILIFTLPWVVYQIVLGECKNAEEVLMVPSLGFCTVAVLCFILNWIVDAGPSESVKKSSTLGSKNAKSY